MLDTNKIITITENWRLCSKKITYIILVAHKYALHIWIYINKALSYQLYDATFSFLGLLVVETRDTCYHNGIALHYSVIFL